MSGCGGSRAGCGDRTSGFADLGRDVVDWERDVVAEASDVTAGDRDIVAEGWDAVTLGRDAVSEAWGRATQALDGRAEGHRLYQCRVDRRGEAPLVPPYCLRSSNKAMVHRRLWWAIPTLQFSAERGINFRWHTARQKQLTLDLDQSLKQGISHGADC